MRKVKIIVVFSILICTFLSCSNGFLKDPRLYNPKRASSQTVAPEPELQLPGEAYKPGLCKDFSAIKFLFEMKSYAVGEAFYARH